MPLFHEGRQRTFNENILLAFALSGVAGAVNTIGFLELGTFTSHMSGGATRIGESLARGSWRAAWNFGVLIVAFALGAMTATVLIERARFLRRARYAAGLLVEALLLTGYAITTEVVPKRPDWMVLPLVLTLCFAMGLQNALVTKISGAVVRTTHLTGIVTDFSIEVVRLAVWFRRTTKGATTFERLQRSVLLRNDPELTRAKLHLTIILAFISGSAGGAAVFLARGPIAMVIPIGILIAFIVYDRAMATSGQEIESDYTPTYASEPPPSAPGPMPAAYETEKTE